MANSNQSVIDELKWKKFPVLSDGFITLVDVMGTDSDIVQAARVSYNKDNRDGQTRLYHTLCKMYPDVIKIKCDITDYFDDMVTAAEKAVVQDERTLLRYLMRMAHSTPLEMAEIKMLIRIPMDSWRQAIRHRAFNTNEYSTRYTEAIDSRDVTSPDQWRLQSGTNKQGSSGFVNNDSPMDDYSNVTTGEYLSAMEYDFHNAADALYKERLNLGVAREQARKDLPLSTYTEAYWKCDIHNLLHFLRLRMDSHAQLEIRSYANIIGNEIVAKLFPMTWEAFVDYRLESMQLTRLDILVINELIHHFQFDGPVNQKKFDEQVTSIISNKREREECFTKMVNLGLCYII